MGVYIPNMEKPKNCAECFYGLRCKVVPRWITTDYSIPKGCPLIEIATCGECKYANYLTEDTDVKCMMTQLFMDKSDFCSCGKRRK